MLVFPDCHGVEMQARQQIPAIFGAESTQVPFAKWNSLVWLQSTLHYYSVFGKQNIRAFHQSRYQ